MCVGVCMCVCTCVCMCVCLGVCMCAWQLRGNNLPMAQLTLFPCGQNDPVGQDLGEITNPSEGSQ